ncbi:MAG TPA: hypothetical protein VEK07_04390 [Polyangiaceae bacterium]|nr:hypothetical protein [Polyangiaceae bacterium]
MPSNLHREFSEALARRDRWRLQVKAQFKRIAEVLSQSRTVDGAAIRWASPGQGPAAPLAEANYERDLESAIDWFPEGGRADLVLQLQPGTPEQTSRFSVPVTVLAKPGTPAQIKDHAERAVDPVLIEQVVEEIRDQIARRLLPNPP